MVGRNWATEKSTDNKTDLTEKGISLLSARLSLVPGSVEKDGLALPPARVRIGR
jgi:hypothetical protein